MFRLISSFSYDPLANKFFFGTLLLGIFIAVVFGFKGILIFNF